MKKITATALCLSLMIVLSGCTFLLEEPSALISPPASSADQYRERQMISSALGRDERLEIPKEMDNPAASTNLDIDGDGEDEKLVFWTRSNGYQAGATLLDHNDDKGWIALDETRQNALSIDYFKLVDIDRDGSDEALIGMDSGGYHTLYIYRMTSSGFDCLDQMNYTRLSVNDLYKNGDIEVICALADNNAVSPRTSVNLYRWKSGGMHRVYSESFEGNCRDMRYGTVAQGTEGLYLMQTTDYTNGSVYLLLPDEENGLRARLTSQILYYNMNGTVDSPIADVNGDGILEVRSVVQPADTSKREASDYFQMWKVWTGEDDMQTVYGMMNNHTDGYRFIVPGEWLESMRYQFVTGDGNNELRIYDGVSDTPAVIIYTQDKIHAAETAANEACFPLDVSGTNQHYYFAQRNLDTFAGNPLDDRIISDAFAIEGGK
jgi:hypothetical protein